MIARIGWIIGAVLLIVGLLLAGGVDPAAAATKLVQSSLGTPRAIAGTLEQTTPLLIAAVGVFIALRAGLFNIGIEGQFLVGALAATQLALAFPTGAGAVAALLGGGIAGAAWAWPAGAIRAYRNGHEVISTIMLNSVALALTDYLVAGPLRDPAKGTAATFDLDPAARLPQLWAGPGYGISASLILAVVLVIATHLWRIRRVAGYELDLVGANPTAAPQMGVRVAPVQVVAMMASGAIGGLAGAVQVLAFEGRFYQGISPGYGFDALGIALLAGPSTLVLIPVSLLFGALAKGSVALQLIGVTKGFVTVIAGIFILIAAIVRVRREATHD
ncbi:MAG: ABC transporter permease [Fimbriimonadaceae bacterium]|nr:ABC transporter permease [Fimbriimonadaceae bacterium]